jgi:hypothetical protein
MSKTLTALALSALTALAAPGVATAQEAGGSFALELNNAATVEGNCRVTYVATNELGTDLEAMTLEIAVFDGEGTVTDTRILLDFGAMAAGKTKAIAFDLAETGCEDISRLLINDVAECTAADGSEPDCLAALETSSRADIDFGL